MKKLGGYRTITDVARGFSKKLITIENAADLFSLVEWWESTEDFERNENDIKWMWGKYTNAVLGLVPPSLQESDIRETKFTDALGSAMGHITNFRDHEQWFITAHRFWKGLSHRDGPLVGCWADNRVERSGVSKFVNSYSISDVARELTDCVIEARLRWKEDEYADQ